MAVARCERWALRESRAPDRNHCIVSSARMRGHAPSDGRQEEPGDQARVALEQGDDLPPSLHLQRASRRLAVRGALGQARGDHPGQLPDIRLAENREVIAVRACGCRHPRSCASPSRRRDPRSATWADPGYGTARSRCPRWAGRSQVRASSSSCTPPRMTRARPSSVCCAAEGA